MISIRVFICEDDELFRNSIAEFLQQETDISVIGFASSVDELLLKSKINSYDILLLDIHLSCEERDGILAALTIKANYPLVKTIILSSLDLEEVISDAMMYGGAINYILKEHYRDLPDAIRNAAYNRSGIHYSSAGKLLQSYRQVGEDDLRQRLKHPQLEILRMLQKGYTRKDRKSVV
jgi:DNA-binding NarL/FixJ family response regulator